MSGEQTYNLTRREEEVLEYLLKGHTNKQISSSLSISTYTAKRHVGSILAKLGVESRTQVVVLLLKSGTFHPEKEIKIKPLEEREQREYERHDIIRRAVEAADQIILNGSDGSVKETNYLTSEVARKFMEKALLPFHSAMLRKDLEG